MYLNQITLIGNVTRDAEIYTTNSGKEVVKFGVAVSRGKDLPTDFFEVTCWERAWAANIAKKGVLILVQGEMRSSKSEDGKVYWSVNANKILLMNSREKKDAEKKKGSSKPRNKDSEYPLYNPDGESENLQ